VAKKGFDVMIDALGLLKARGVAFTAAIAGDGEERESLAERIRAAGLADSIELTGPLDSDQVRAEMNRASVFCLPCTIGDDGNRDALPTVLLEAMAGGLPIVSTPVTGIPEILDEGRAGLLVPERDVEATAHALAELLDGPEHRATFARRGRERARALFDREKQAAILAGWFREVASTATASGRTDVASEVGA
jgi:glycosyltransferase involved in cell wall biosynthesis